MTATIERRVEDNVDIKLKIGDIFGQDGKKERVIKTYYEGEELTRFETARRDEGFISELGYNVNRITGRIEQSYCGIFYEKDAPPFRKSERYSELDKLLREFEK